MLSTGSKLPRLNRTLFHPGQRLAVALSGGADSTALLLALLEANAEKDSLGLVLTAIHIHHGLRGEEADADEAFVHDLCTQHNIPLTVEHVDTLARRQAEGEGLEEAARELRYAAFRQLLRENKADAIATAHTLNDQAETVLMKLLRGAWTEGLAGIAPLLVIPEGDLRLPGPGAPHLDFEMWDETASNRQREAPTQSANPNQQSTTNNRQPTILRPLLATSRAEIERFLHQRHQPWREDTSNVDLTLTRNRIRHQLMPLLRSFNPAIDETLARTAGIARDDHAYWQAEVARIIPGLVLPGKPVRGGGRAVSTAPSDQSSAIEIERLRAHPPALRRRLLRAAAASLGCRLNAEETAKLLALAGLANSPGLTTRNGARLDLANGLHAERSLRELRLSRESSVRIPKKV